MEKFKNVVSVNDKIGGLINNLILSNMETDYTSYELGERIAYNFMMDDDFEWWEVWMKDLKEFVGEGICLVDEELGKIWEKDIWYNISIKDYGECESLLVEFVADETMCEKI